MFRISNNVEPNVSLAQLSNNLISGALPTTAFAALSNLQLLWLDDNALSGDITNTFASMSFLQGLVLEDNLFQGFINDKFLANNGLLVHVDLSGNDLTGYVPNHLFDATRVPILEMLDLNK